MSQSTIEEMKSHIINVIGRKAPIQAIDLALDVMSRVNPQRFETEHYHTAICNLAASGHIIEFGYTETTDPNRIKLIYFQKGTVLMGVETNGERTKDSVGRDSQTGS